VPADADDHEPSGACLQRRWRRWRQLSSVAGSWTRSGVRIPWLRAPKACKRRQRVLSKEEEEFLDKEIQRMLKENAVEESDRKDLILSSIYTVPKKNGKRRPVINLRWVNQHIKKIHFKMSTMKDVKQALTKDCWMASIDLTDCFWGCPLDKKDQRACAFHWKGKNYVFKVLPFGLSLSPYFITKLYRNFVEDLQAKGHRVIMYIDDILILGNSKVACEQSVQAVLASLKDLGARVNFAKSSLCPAQTLEYLGFTLDSKQMKIFAPPKKLLNTKKSLKTFLRGGKATPRDAASILGKLNSLADALLPARVHTAAIHSFKLNTLKNNFNNWDKTSSIGQEAKADADWWLRHLQALNGRDIHPPQADLHGGTDASDFGWGCWIKTSNGLQRWGGHFTREIAQEHINYKELLAVKYFIQSCPPEAHGRVIDLGIDNTTTIWYLKRFGGRRNKLAKLASEIFETIRRRKITLLAHHCPGILNIVADEESRKTKINFLADLALSKTIFQKVDLKFGPHTVDLFATLQDRQISRFCSLHPEPGALWLDSMAHSWRGENAWVNPPFALLFQVLHKVRREQVTVTLLAPFWLSQAWLPLLFSMLVEPPILLPRAHPQFQHPLLPAGKTPRWLSLACKISGDPYVLKTSARRLSKLFSQPGHRRLTRRMTCIGKAGLTSPQLQAKIQQLSTTLFWHRGWLD
jgi:hypothetical protein